MRNLFSLATAGLATVLVFAMVAAPDVAFQASFQGLSLWWDVVFPALLPFFVGGQILMGLGVVRGLGVLLEPIMRPLFNLPGSAGFVTAMGLASGYPIGAVLTAKLRNNNEITVADAERLLSFANTADPLFMAGAVAVGFFGDPLLAGVLIIAHYVGAVATGFVMRFHSPHAERTPVIERGQGFILLRALNAMQEGRREDGRPFGQLLGDCVKQSIETLLLIGGFIILFAVLLALLQTTGASNWLTQGFGLVAAGFGLSETLGEALTAGLFEITLGTQKAAQAAAPLDQRLIAASAVIAFAGLGVHAQVAAIMQGTGIRLAPYMVARVLHALFAGLVTAALLWWDPDWATSHLFAGLFGPAQVATSTGVSGTGWLWLEKLFASSRWLLVVFSATTVFATAAAVCAWLRRRIIIWHTHAR